MLKIMSRKNYEKLKLEFRLLEFLNVSSHFQDFYNAPYSEQFFLVTDHHESYRYAPFLRHILLSDISRICGNDMYRACISDYLYLSYEVFIIEIFVP